MPQPKPLPPLELLRELFRYDQETGFLYYRKQPSVYRRSDLSKPVGTCGKNGYLVITLSRTSYRVHRLIWKIAYGVEPAAIIDHKNGNRLDNKLSNLREATSSQNVANSRRNAPKRGVTKYRGKWKAQCAGKSKVFSTWEEAHQVHVQWHLQDFGEFSIYADA